MERILSRDLRFYVVLVFFLSVLLAATFLAGCTRKSSSGPRKLWVYTSMYKDTVADLTPRLKAAMPDVEIEWFQAGSEEIATKVSAEMIAGGTQADVLMSSDRFWYEDLAKQGKLKAYEVQAAKGVPQEWKNPGHFYTAVSQLAMVLAYNKEVVPPAGAPKTFKELTDPKWKNKVSTGSALGSGTQFSTVAFLQHKYGWDYYKALRANGLIAEGGNSSVIRRLQSKERPVGVVLLENILRLQTSDERIVPVYPEDGVVILANVLALVAKPQPHPAAERFAEWMFGKEGQEAMARSYMYSPMEGFAPPKGAIPLADVKKKAFPWTETFLHDIMSKRDSLKEMYTKVLFE